MAEAEHPPAIQHVSQLPGRWPDPASLIPFAPDEAQAVARQIAPKIRQLLCAPAKTAEVLQELYLEDGFWRDHVAFTYSLRTLHGLQTIAGSISPLVARAQVPAESVKLVEEQVNAIELPNGVSVLRVPFNFRTTAPAASCSLAVKLVRLANGQVKIITATSALQELNARPWRPVIGAEDVPLKSSVPEVIDVLVAGAGHAGLAIGAFLKALGINFAIFERDAAVGDSWAKRYDSATLHTTRIFSGLPYLPFPDNFPLYVPGKLIAQYYDDYARKLELPIFCNSEVKKAVFDQDSNAWAVSVFQNGHEKTIRAKTLVFAMGVMGRWPKVPDFKGKESFRGPMLHSSTYVNADPFKGKKVAVIGASTTACDVCYDCSKQGIDVTMIQRGPTRIYPQAHITAAQRLFWNENIPVEVGDTMASEDPVALQAPLSHLILGRFKDAHDPAYYSGLTAAGFLTTVDGAIHQQVLCMTGNHYPDIGACEAIAQGKIKVKSGTTIQSITERGVSFEDGSHVSADVIIFATGFEKDNRKPISAIIGKEEAQKLEPVWGLDPEGEIRGVYRPTGRPHLWIQGGELQTMRYYGKFLALQIAAELDGLRPEPQRARDL